jgi:hypothetical protein
MPQRPGAMIAFGFRAVLTADHVLRMIGMVWLDLVRVGQRRINKLLAREVWLHMTLASSMTPGDAPPSSVMSFEGAGDSGRGWAECYSP